VEISDETRPYVTDDLLVSKRGPYDYSNLHSFFSLLMLHADGNTYNLFYNEDSTCNGQTVYDRLNIPSQFIPEKNKKVKRHDVVCEYRSDTDRSRNGNSK